MPNGQSKKPLVITIIVALIIIIAIVTATSQNTVDTKAGWQAYQDTEYGFGIQRPADWQIYDALTKETCCLFITKYEEGPRATTTGTTTVAVSSLRIGYYYTDKYDPFTVASTTEKKLGKNIVYMGDNKGIPYYILKKSETEGLIMAVLLPADDRAADFIKTVEGMIATIRLAK